MKVKCIKAYYDLQLKKSINVDDILEVDEARGAELTTKNNKAGQVLAEVVEEVKAPTPTTAKKRGKAAKKDV
jgi:ribosomal protein L21